MGLFMKFFAGVAQLVEHHVANVKVVGSLPISRSIQINLGVAYVV